MTESPSGAEAALTLTLDSPAATERLAARIASRAAARDVIALWGNLGAGKTAFARAFIRARAGDPAIEVPSPTFTLVQTYDLQPPVWHFDLYRLISEDDVWELGIEEALADAISLIEWPERLGALLPDSRLDVGFASADRPEARRASITGHGTWAARLEGLAHA
jgi:tRNA threonylcarbamoyl adenosine modification protein YjeE